MEKNTILTPLAVPTKKKELFIKNYSAATKNSGKLFLFAGDQKIEHLNADFYGKNIPEECGSPQHLFDIAAQAHIGVFATQLGMIARYGHTAPDINYVIKLNAKTNLVPTKQAEPISLALNTISDVVELKENSKLHIVGVGYTIYLGSQDEANMLSEAAQMIYDAHQNGLLAILWIYPRGKAISNEDDADLIAGATGVATALGADFVKINPPKTALLLQQATMAAGNTGVICSGGKTQDPQYLIKKLYKQIHTGGARGCAYGRNIHQRTVSEAIALCNAISAIVIDKKTLEEAIKLL